MPEPANIPYLPPEILVPIIAYSEEKQVCLVNLLSSGSLKCEEQHSFTTVIYTRGDLDQDGKYTRGSIEALPLRHRCVYRNVRENSEPAIPLNQADDLSIELQRWNLTKRVIVMDVGREEDIRKEAHRTKEEYRSEPWLPDLHDVARLVASSTQAKLNFWDKRIFDTIPLVNHTESGNIGLEVDNGAYVNRLRPEDDHLACEKIRHLMIRPFFKSTDKGYDIIEDELRGQLKNYFRELMLLNALELNYYGAMDFMFRLDWHLLKNLEVLCLDVTSVDPNQRYPKIQANLVEMGRHLKLKTLILLGASCVARYDDKGKEAWVAALEDDAHVEGDDDHSLISLLKETLRPGGQIHCIDYLGPENRWSPYAEAEESDLDTTEIELLVQGREHDWQRFVRNVLRRDFESSSS
ncbi:hypothetical protein ACHAPI_007727 [Fusarium lateritium]